MKIYIGIKKEVANEDVKKIKLNLISELKKYYGLFGEDEIIFYINNLDYVEVFVMNHAKYPGYDKKISDSIKFIISNIIHEKTIDVKLNYESFDPTFDPTKSLMSGNVRETQELIENDKKSKSEEFDYEKLSENYQAELPRYSFDQVILSKSLTDQILEAVGTIQVEYKVFDEWGLRNIIPNASSALSFYGPPGTGKSMAAEAIANKLGKKILRATYADIESKYHGEGPKMVKAIFKAAERDDAILFIDESDSLLSKRLTDVSDGSAQAINSMRSQLLICLEQFKGIVIFATNLVVNYDKAFLSRLISIEFTVPDEEARAAIWEQHLKGLGLKIPLDDNLNIKELAEKYVFCGREIKNSVKDACVTVALSGRNKVAQEDLIKAAEKTKIESEKVLNAHDHTESKLSDSETDAIKNAMQKHLDKETNQISVSELENNIEE